MDTGTPPRRSTFPSTRWSRIVGGTGGRDLEALARSYWRPIRAWLAARLRLRDEAADDLTQEAFTWMLASHFFERADPARGRFRAFLKTALRHFVVQHWRHANALRRGGAQAHTSLRLDDDLSDGDALQPDEILDAEWRRDLLQRARDRLAGELEGSGRAVYFALFRDYYLADDDVDHRTLAERHGVSRGDVSNWLDYAKRRYRAILRALVRDTVDDEEALQVEWSWLFATTERGEGR
ncbi:MAG: sigma-70 family RNA polymerase sigma factor [Planctomycetota bacterium]